MDLLIGAIEMDTAESINKSLSLPDERRSTIPAVVAPMSPEDDPISKQQIIFRAQEITENAGRRGGVELTVCFNGEMAMEEMTKHSEIMKRNY